MHLLGLILVCLLLSASSNAPASHGLQQSLPDPAALDGLLTKVGRSVQETNKEILGLAWSETIVTEELDEQLRPKAKPKEYRYDAIVVRQKSPNNPAETRLVASRELKTVDGKPTSQSELKAESVATPIQVLSTACHSPSFCLRNVRSTTSPSLARSSPRKVVRYL
jgi:hypothetical protein